MIAETQIVAEPGKQELFIIREFEASRERVFEAFSDPDLLVQFFAPFDNTMHFNHHDYRTGGSYSWCNKDKNGKILCTFAGVIHELKAPELMIYTSQFMEMPAIDSVVLEVITFDALTSYKTKVTIHDVCLSVATRDAIVNSGMDKGLVDIFRKLDRLLK